MRVQQLGMAHPDAAATLHSLAELARSQGDEARALSIQRDLLQALREAGVAPPDEPGPTDAGSADVPVVVSAQPPAQPGPGTTPTGRKAAG